MINDDFETTITCPNCEAEMLKVSRFSENYVCQNSDCGYAESR